MSANERLGLPRGKMAKVIVAFDVDGTILANGDLPIHHQIVTLQVLSTYKNIRIVVWSGGGKQYAETWGKRLGLDKYVWRYASKLEHEEIKRHCETLIAIDDIQDTAIGDINLIVREK